MGCHFFLSEVSHNCYQTYLIWTFCFIDQGTELIIAKEKIQDCQNIITTLNSEVSIEMLKEQLLQLLFFGVFFIAKITS